jgi:hypothetical protein
MDPFFTIRIELSTAHVKASRVAACKLIGQLVALGIDVDDDGRVRSAERVLNDIDAGEHWGLSFLFGWGDAADGSFGQPNSTRLMDPDIDAEEYRDGATYYGDVLAGLEYALESHQWRDMPSVPADDINAMALARAEQRRIA